MWLPDQTQNESILAVNDMLAVKRLEDNTGTSEQEMAVPTPEQLSKVSVSRKLDLFKITCKVLRIPKAIEMIRTRPRMMPWFRAVMTVWVSERAKHHIS